MTACMFAELVAGLIRIDLGQDVTGLLDLMVPCPEPAACWIAVERHGNRLEAPVCDADAQIGRALAGFVSTNTST